MTAKLTASADGLSGSLAVGANEAFQFKPVAGGLELSQDGITFQTVDTDGKVAFPQMGQLFGNNGYIKLPGGLIVQWGTVQISPQTANTWATGAVDFPIPFPNNVFSLFVNSSNNASLTSTVISWAIAKSNLSTCSISSQAPVAPVGGAQCFYLAIGN